MLPSHIKGSFTVELARGDLGESLRPAWRRTGSIGLRAWGPRRRRVGSAGEVGAGQRRSPGVGQASTRRHVSRGSDKRAPVGRVDGDRAAVCLMRIMNVNKSTVQKFKIEERALSDKGGKSIPWSRDCLLQKWCWENRTGSCKKKKIMELDHPLTPYPGVNSKWIKGLHLRLEAIKVLEETIAICEPTHLLGQRKPKGK